MQGRAACDVVQLHRDERHRLIGGPGPGSRHTTARRRHRSRASSPAGRRTTPIDKPTASPSAGRFLPSQRTYRVAPRISPRLLEEQVVVIERDCIVEGSVRWRVRSSGALTAHLVEQSEHLLLPVGLRDGNVSASPRPYANSATIPNCGTNTSREPYPVKGLRRWRAMVAYSRVDDGNSLNSRRDETRTAPASPGNGRATTMKSSPRARSPSSRTQRKGRQAAMGSSQMRSEAEPRDDERAVLEPAVERACLEVGRSRRHDGASFATMGAGTRGHLRPLRPRPHRGARAGRRHARERFLQAAPIDPAMLEGTEGRLKTASFDAVLRDGAVAHRRRCVRAADGGHG